MTTETEIKTAVETQGLIDASERIMRELIATPKFKEAIIALLNSIDPPAARRLVRTLFWHDPGLLMSIMGSLPAMVNVASEALAEVANQMNSLPPLLLRDFLNRVFAGIDGAAAGEAVGGLVGTVLSLELSEKERRLAQSLSGLGSGFSRASAEAAGSLALPARLEAWVAGIAEKAVDPGSSTYAFVQAAGKAIKDNPAFVENVLKPLLGPALKAPAAKKAPARKAAARKPAEPGRGEEG